MSDEKKFVENHVVFFLKKIYSYVASILNKTAKYNIGKSIHHDVTIVHFCGIFFEYVSDSTHGNLHIGLLSVKNLWYNFTEECDDLFF